MLQVPTQKNVERTSAKCIELEILHKNKIISSFLSSYLAFNQQMMYYYVLFVRYKEKHKVVSSHYNQ